MPVLFPQVIAARVRQARGTLTVTSGAPARTTSPAFRQYGHCRFPDETICWRNAGGTETTPSTTRYPPPLPDLTRRITSSQGTVRGAVSGAALTVAPAGSASATATRAATRLIAPEACTLTGSPAQSEP